MKTRPLRSRVYICPPLSVSYKLRKKNILSERTALSSRNTFLGHATNRLAPAACLPSRSARPARLLEVSPPATTALPAAAAAAHPSPMTMDPYQTDFQAPNVAADEAPNAPRGVASSATIFARTATAFTRDLRRAYRARLQAGDDAGVLASAAAARVVERSAAVYASAATVVAVRGRVHDDPSAAADAAAGRDYLVGAQARLDAALLARDVPALSRCADAAEAAMHALAHPESAFAAMDSPDSSATVSADVDESPALDRKSRSYLPFFAMAMGYPGAPGDSDSDGRPPRKKRGCCGILGGLNPTDKVIIAVYLVMVVLALIAVGFITNQFVSGLKNPESFVRPRITNSLPAPVVTLCLSQSGIPFSRLQIFNFTDATGRSFRGVDPQGAYAGRASKEFRAVVERFWDNPDREDCNKVVGDFFPLPTKSLNDMAAGRKTSRCRPCYRFGSKQEVTVNSTAFADSSFILALTDNYFIECLKRPGGPSKKSLEFIHKFVREKILGKLGEFGVLARADGGAVTGLSQSNIEKLNGKQLCNVFYFSFFPKMVKKMGKQDNSIRYVFTGTKWEFRGTAVQFQPPPVAEDPFFPLESLQFFVSTNKTAVRGSLRNQKDMALIGPSTQTYASFRPLVLEDRTRFDVQTSTSNLIDAAVKPILGYWVQYRLMYNFNRFIQDEYYTDATYSFSQWLIDFTGYLSLFTGASVFSVLLLPVLLGVRARQRARMRAEQPEAYVWKQHRKRFAQTRQTHVPEPVAARAASMNDEGGGGNLRLPLPGYNM